MPFAPDNARSRAAELLAQEAILDQVTEFVAELLRKTGKRAPGPMIDRIRWLRVEVMIDRARIWESGQS